MPQRTAVSVKRENDGQLSPEIYRPMRAWKAQADEQRKKKQTAILERDQTAGLLQIRTHELECVYRCYLVALLMLPKGKRAQCREQMRIELGFTTAGEMLTWEERMYSLLRKLDGTVA